MKRTNVAVWLEKYNRWQINVQKDGVRRTFTCSKPGRTGQRACHAKADAWLDDNITGTNTRVEALYKDFLETLKLKTSYSNWRPIDSLWSNWILPEIGKRKIGDINEHHLQHVIDKAYAAGLSKKTLTNLRGTMNSFIKYCRKRKVTTFTPEDLTIPHGARSKKKNILQPEHLAILFSVNTTVYRGKKIVDPLINAYRFHVLTGLRPGELMGLEWNDIVGREVRLTRAINEHKEITTGKNENAVRRFILADFAADALAEQRKISTTDRVFGDILEQHYRFSWYRYCDANDIPRVTPYEMRHTFVSIAKQLSEGQIKPIVGHSKNMDTFGVYGHEMRDELRKTADQLGGIFAEILDTEKHTL